MQVGNMQSKVNIIVYEYFRLIQQQRFFHKCFSFEFQLLVQEASTIFEKIRVYFNRCWNYLTFLAIVTFFIGFALRCNQPTRHSYGRIILSCNIVFWYIKLLDFMGVHPRLGPYIQMTGKMVGFNPRIILK